MELQGSEFLIDTHNAHTGNVIMHALCIVVGMIPVDFFPPPSLV